jgi:hypothetical protein
MSRAGLSRAEGQVVTSTSASSQILIQQPDSITGQLTPAQITVANLFSGGADTPIINVGASGVPGTLNIFPPTVASGKLTFTATNNTGNTTTTITNAAMGQASVISVPDPGASTANFALDKFANVFTAAQQINTLNIGASGTLGALNLFSTTASKGKWLFVPVDNTGNTTMTITNAAQAGAYTYTIPSAGASASFMMTQGAQTVVGAQTFSADITASANVIINTAGKGVQIKEGSNARMGTATLSSGTVTVANTSVTASTRIFLSRYSIGASAGAIGVLSVGTVSAGTSFIINALKTADHTVETNDVSVVHWLLVEPL